jgi:hypothetical protein
MKKFDWEYCSEKDIVLFRGLPCEGLVNEYNLIKDRLNGPKETRSAVDENGAVLKENEGIFLSQIYSAEFSDVSPTGRLFAEIFKEIKHSPFPIKSTMNAFKASTGFNVLMSKYNAGHYYKPHRDHTTATILVWPLEKKFKGGDFIFPELDFRIVCEAGTGVIFPGHYIHAVEEVFSENEDDVRVTFTGFVH